jgi:DNA polymerase I
MEGFCLAGTDGWRSVVGMSEPVSPLLLIVDGHAYAYRAFHAIRSLNAPDGSPTNALYGFIKMLQKMEGIVQPTHRLVVWDGGLAAERQSALPEYKANRPPTPEGLEAQIPQLIEWLGAAGIASWQQEGAEADDWIGTYARRAEATGWRAVVASSDKDFMQLVTERVGLLNPNDKSEKIWGAAEVVAKAGVGPAQIVDWLSLLGDAVDNIPGVPGVGPKTAAELLNRFGTVDGIYARLSEIKSERQRGELTGAIDAVRRNQALVRLKTDLADGPAMEALAPVPRDGPRLRAMYRRWNFRGMLAELGGDVESAPSQGSLAL